MKVHYPKLYNMAHLLALNVLLLPKDLTIIFILNTLQKHAHAIYKKKKKKQLQNQKFHWKNFDIFSSPEPKAYSKVVEPAFFRVCVRPHFQT